MTTAKHAKFAAKHNLTAPLATDKDGGLSDALGVWGEKSLYGKLFMGMHRTTYLVDAEGTIVRVWPPRRCELLGTERILDAGNRRPAMRQRNFVKIANETGKSAKIRH